MGKKKLSIEDVKKFVKESSECKLLSEEYVNVDSLLKFECKCGEKFETTFYKFNKREKRQCNSCGFAKGQHKRLRYEDVKDFIENKSQSGCKLLSESYNNAHEKLNIQCRCGEVFSTKWAHFRNSNQRQCKTCGLAIRSAKKRLPLEDVNGYINSKGCQLKSEYTNSYSKIQIECQCKKVFTTTFALFRDYGLTKCHSCRSKLKTSSKGEDKIRDWLSSQNVVFEEQFTFDDLRIEKKLRFDFAILNKNKKVKLLIEFDGRQHFGLGNFSDDTEKMLSNFERIQESDRIKNEFCFTKSIPILRIPYNKYAKIEQILSDALL